ncbi:MAG: homoserine dehydrogenase [Dehalococcoidia bacterium]|nr:homoserine dehydrogenase [Dehalococcoidia bacterium]
MAKPRQSVNVGLLGLGVIGGGVARVLLGKAASLSAEVGCPLKLKRIAEVDASRARSVPGAASLITSKADEVLNDPEIDIVIEVIGGENPAVEYMQRALSGGKHVVTANKEVIAKHGPELLDLAQKNQVDLRFEASVGGGIPLISPFRQDLLANEITAVHAIINGTTNYILTQMAKEGQDFAVALKQAQELGYAERNPTNDVEGIDAAYKISILASLAFHTIVRPEDVYHEGISRLTGRDFRYAKELGYAIKLLAIAKKDDNAVQARVHPVFVPEDFILAKVDDVFNAVLLDGDLVGKLLFYGKGAGAAPTSSAIVADVIRLAQNISLGVPQTPRLHLEHRLTIKHMSDLDTRYYIRLNVADRPGVLAQISTILGNHAISIASVIQKEADPQAQTAEIVIMTHPARESGMQQALRDTQALAVTKEVANFIRVED